MSEKLTEDMLIATGKDLKFKHTVLYNDVEPSCGDPDCENPRHFTVEKLADDAHFVTHKDEQELPQGVEGIPRGQP